MALAPGGAAIVIVATKENEADADQPVRGESLEAESLGQQVGLLLIGTRSGYRQVDVAKGAYGHRQTRCRESRCTGLIERRTERF